MNRNTMLNIEMGSRNSGLTVMAKNMQPIMYKFVWIESSSVRDKYSSITPMSLAKRFNIRPDGFKLKNRIVAEIIA